MLWIITGGRHSMTWSSDWTVIVFVQASILKAASFELVWSNLGRFWESERLILLLLLLLLASVATKRRCLSKAWLSFCWWVAARTWTHSTIKICGIGRILRSCWDFIPIASSAPLLFLLEFTLSLSNCIFIVGYLRRCLRAHDWFYSVLCTKLWLIHTVAIVGNSLKCSSWSA